MTQAGSIYPQVTAWQRPTLPGPFGPSTIGAGRLNGRVRDGYAWFPSAIVTKPDFSKHYCFDQAARKYPTLDYHFCKAKYGPFGSEFFEALLLRSGCEKISYLKLPFLQSKIWPIRIGFFEALLLRSGCEKISGLEKACSLNLPLAPLKTSSEAKCT
jgi:hypothetical protein